MDEATLARVEEQRLQLETTIATLRRSLRHWQTLEIDYEGLKEEFLGLPETASSQQCLQAANNFGPETIVEKELETLLSDKTNGYKKPSQLVDVLTKRSDYVLRNIETIRKQLSNAEKKRNALLLAGNPEFQDDAGLPLKEITEELDEEGEVISSTVQAPGEKASQLADVLRMAGVTDLKMDEQDTESVGDAKNEDTLPISSLTSNISVRETPKIKNQTSTVGIEEDNGSIEDEITQGPDNLGPVNLGDTEDDAALRQEMLQYGLGEVGAIVAELDLQDDASDVPYDEYEEDEDMSDFDEDDDIGSDVSEDECGALKTPLMSDRYVRKMETLQKRFEAEGLQNVGPTPDVPEGIQDQVSRPSAAEAARKAALARAESEQSKQSAMAGSRDEEATSSKPERRRVAFAEELDIAEELDTPNHENSNPAPQHEIKPVAEAVFERTAGDKQATSHTLPPKKISQFRASRMSTPQTSMFPPKLDLPAPKVTPEGPQGKIIARELVERPAQVRTEAPDPSDFDEELHRREVAVEYQKARNRKIHEQGGYVKGGEQDNYGDEFAMLPVEDDKTGKPRKLSRFKAARIQSGSS